MTTPRRFTTFSDVSPEGRLLAAGKAEYPNEATLRRAAARLGLPAVTVGTAAAAGSMATAKATAATTSAASAGAATVSASTALPSASSSILTVTFLKATVIGVAIGAGTIGTADLALHDTAPTSTGIAPTAVAQPVQKPQRASQIRASAAAPNSSVVAQASSASDGRTAASDGRHTGASEIRQAVQASRPQLVAPVVEEAPTLELDALSHSVPSSPDPKTRLAREVESLDRARAAVSRGDASGALRELDEFASHQPYRLLAGEVMLVRIEALLALGNRREASALARQVLRLGAPAPQRARLERLARME